MTSLKKKINFHAFIPDNLRKDNKAKNILNRQSFPYVYWLAVSLREYTGDWQSAALGSLTIEDYLQSNIFSRQKL